ncbi:hypothetical protein KBT16_03335, partial [Nostoc sp. CCCryo 231-06]|nr:hypothetical protein [Nostoc sp. CCCryo 231-06]
MRSQFQEIVIQHFTISNRFQISIAIDKSRHQTPERNSCDPKVVVHHPTDSRQIPTWSNLPYLVAIKLSWGGSKIVSAFRIRT